MSIGPTHLTSKFANPIHSPTRCNIFLDLDLTIIESLASDEVELRDVTFQSRLQDFEFENMEDIYIVVARPGLQDFLDFLFANFNVSVWTAASKDYAMFIIAKFILNKPGRCLDWVFFDYHCDVSEDKTGEIKKMSLLWDLFHLLGYRRSNTLIIDDNYSDVFKHQPASVVLCPPFVFADKKSRSDNFFERLKPLLLQFREECNDSKADEGDRNGGPAEKINRIIDFVSTARRKSRV